MSDWLTTENVSSVRCDWSAPNECMECELFVLTGRSNESELYSNKFSIVWMKRIYFATVSFTRDWISVCTVNRVYNVDQYHRTCLQHVRCVDRPPIGAFIFDQFVCLFLHSNYFRWNRETQEWAQRPLQRSSGHSCCDNITIDPFRLAN